MMRNVLIGMNATVVSPAWLWYESGIPYCQYSTNAPERECVHWTRLHKQKASEWGEKKSPAAVENQILH